MIERKSAGTIIAGQITTTGDVENDSYKKSVDLIKIPNNCLSVILEYIGTGNYEDYVNGSIWSYKEIPVGSYDYYKNSSYGRNPNPEAPNFYFSLSGNRNDFGTHVRCCFKNYYDIISPDSWGVDSPTFVFDRGNTWYIDDNGELKCENLAEDIDSDEPVMEEPYPPFLWYVDEDIDDLNNSFLSEQTYQGAFCNCTELKTVVIPASVKYIGEYAFYNTALTAVTIARDCTFFPTSFPPRCIIQYYLD